MGENHPNSHLQKKKKKKKKKKEKKKKDISWSTILQTMNHKMRILTNMVET
jgi:hypothetical protein